MSPPPLVPYFEGMFPNEPLDESGMFTIPSELEATCYHEASHAVGDYLFGRPIQSIGVRAAYSVSEDGELMVGYGGEVVAGRRGGRDRIVVHYPYRKSHFSFGCVLGMGPAGERRYRHEVQIPMRMLGATEGDHHSISSIGKGLQQFGRCRHAYQRHVWYHAQKVIARDDVWGAVRDAAEDLFSEAAFELESDKPGEFWTYLKRTHLYSACRRHGLKRGMFAA